MALDCQLFGIGTLLELSDRAAVDAEIDRYAERAERTRQPRYLWTATQLRALQALLDARFAEAEALARTAFELGRSVHPRRASQALVIQRIAARRFVGGLEEMVPPLVRLLEPVPLGNASRTTLCFVYRYLGREDEARREFEALAADGFAAIPQTPNWLSAMYGLADVSSYLGDTRRGASLHRLLEPYARYAAIVGAVASCVGPVAHPLGLVASAARQWRAAEAHFEEALRVAERLHAPALGARVRLDFARMLRRSRGLERAASRAGRLREEATRATRSLGLAELLAQAERDDARAGLA
jgi:hypothetical protein